MDKMFRCARVGVSAAVVGLGALASGQALAQDPTAFEEVIAEADLGGVSTWVIETGAPVIIAVALAMVGVKLAKRVFSRL